MTAKIQLLKSQGLHPIGVMDFELTGVHRGESFVLADLTFKGD